MYYPESTNILEKIDAQKTFKTQHGKSLTCQNRKKHQIIYILLERDNTHENLKKKDYDFQGNFKLNL